MQRHLTFANITSLLALFVALGGTSYAVATIGTSQVRNNSLRGKDVRNGTLTSRDVKKGSLGSRAVKESALGKVPRSRSADLLGGKSADQLTVRCPAGTQFNAGTCVETGSRAAAAYGVAKVGCEAADRRLVTHQELVGVVDDSDIALAPGGELTADVYPNGTSLDVLYVTNDTGSVAVTPNTFAGRKAFRCAVDPFN